MSGFQLKVTLLKEGHVTPVVLMFLICQAVTNAKVAETVLLSVSVLSSHTSHVHLESRWNTENSQCVSH